jgi:hypothetical protein
MGIPPVPRAQPASRLSIPYWTSLQYRSVKEEIPAEEGMPRNLSRAYQPRKGCPGIYPGHTSRGRDAPEFIPGSLITSPSAEFIPPVRRAGSLITSPSAEFIPPVPRAQPASRLSILYWTSVRSARMASNNESDTHGPGAPPRMNIAAAPTLPAGERSWSRPLRRRLLGFPGGPGTHHTWFKCFP